MSSLFDRHIKDYVYGKYVEARMAGRGKAFQISVTSMAQIEEAVAELRDIDKDKAIRAGLRSAANFLSRQGQKRLSQRSYRTYVTRKGNLTKEGKTALAAHNLFNAFQVRVKRRSLGALVGFNYRGHHAHLVDRGTTKRPHPITGTSGVMPANEFWTDTADQDWGKAMDMVQETIKRSVNRIKMRSNNY